MADSSSEVAASSETVRVVPSASVVKEEESSEARPSSPDPSCPICLDNVTDTAYTDMCCHRFCFHCLVSWSRVKPECPLCKQRFNLIIHNVRSLGDYDELPVTWPEPPPPALDANFFISVAFQRPRFRYRTTGWGWRIHDFLAGPSSQMATNSFMPIASIPNTLPTVTSSTNSVATAPITSVPPPTLTSSTSPSTYAGNTLPNDWRRRRQVSACEFRNNVYRQNQWVCPIRPRPGVPYRIRESTPEFYRNNPTQANRLLPWLHRELLVLLDVRYDCQHVCQKVLQAITTMPIRSSRFQSLMWPYLHERTPHFIHEFYNFATSPFDMLAYDLRAEYVRRDSDYTELVVSEPERLNSDSSDVEVIEPPENHAEPIEISDDDGDTVVRVDDGGNNSDTSVEIISTLPPLTEREPEIINLIDSCSDSDMDLDLDISPPIDVDLSPLSAVNIPRPTRSRERRQRLCGRVKEKYPQYYCKDLWSSTSDEEFPARRRQVRKRKRKTEPAKKRKRIVENYSSSSDSGLDDEVQKRLRPSRSADSVSSSGARQTRSMTKCKSSSEDKYSGNKSCSSTSTSSASSRSSRHKKASPDSSASRSKCSKDNKRSDESEMECAEGDPENRSAPLHLKPLSTLMKTENDCSDTGQVGDSMDIESKWMSPSRQCAEGEQYQNDADQQVADTNRLSPVLKPRLKSVVMRVDTGTEAGCSSWPLHNLRHRPLTRYAYTPYFSSSSDSDS